MIYQLETKICRTDGSQLYLRLPAPYETIQEAYDAARTIQEQYQVQDSASVSSRHWFVINANDRNPDPQYILGLFS